MKTIIVRTVCILLVMALSVGIYFFGFSIGKQNVTSSSPDLSNCVAWSDGSGNVYLLTEDGTLWCFEYDNLILDEYSLPGMEGYLG